jgi:hypothetical protein
MGELLFRRVASTRTVTVWDSLKSFKIRWLFQMPLHSQQRLNSECPRLNSEALQPKCQAQSPIPESTLVRLTQGRSRMR